MSQNYHDLSDSDSENYVRSESQSQPESESLDGQTKVIKPRKRKEVNENAAIEKKKKKEKFELISPQTCMNYITVHIDSTLNKYDFFLDLTAVLNSKPLSVQCSAEGEEDSIYWYRKQCTGDKTREPHYLIIWDHIKLLKNIENGFVISHFDNLRKEKPECRFYLVIYGLKEYCKRLKKKSKLTDEEKTLTVTPSKNIVDDILCDLEIIHNISSRLIDNIDELSEYVGNITKSVAEEPYRKEKEKIECEKSSYLIADFRKCVRVDKQNLGMTRLWQQQLAELPHSSVDCAKAIMALYPSPYSLYETYKSIDTQIQREQLLQDLTVGREGSRKRLGPEMSKKICQLFSSQETTHLC